MSLILDTGFWLKNKFRASSNVNANNICKLQAGNRSQVLQICSNRAINYSDPMLVALFGRRCGACERLLLFYLCGTKVMAFLAGQHSLSHAYGQGCYLKQLIFADETDGLL